MGLIFNPVSCTFDFTGSGGGSGTPGGADTNVQFNDGGTFGGNSGFLYDKTGQVSSLGPAAALDAGIILTLAASPTSFPLGHYIGEYIDLQPNPSANTTATLTAGDFELQTAANASTYDTITSVYALAAHRGTGAMNALYAIWADADVNGAATVTNLYGVRSNVSVKVGATVTTAYGFETTLGPMTGTTSTLIAFWSPALTNAAANAYSFWHDAQGVFRIRESNTFDSVYQAIPALYNPQFTKYTPGATNYERIVQQWESNVATIRTEANGTGTLRVLNLGGSQVSVNAVYSDQLGIPDTFLLMGA